METERIVTVTVEISVPIDWDSSEIEDNVKDAIIDGNKNIDVIGCGCEQHF